jgi:hypothetical protein
MILTAYALGLDKTLGVTQGFQGTAEDHQAIGFVLAFQLIFALLSAAGAAYLSIKLNTHLGTSSGWMMFYAVLAFLFSEIYYPVYAFFFNPIGAKPKGANSGSRRNNA